jgi:cell division protein FtsZ
MAIMTGVQSAQVLGPTTQKQADKSRESIEGLNEGDFDASNNVETGGFGAQSDGGREEIEQQNGVDVIR